MLQQFYENTLGTTFIKSLLGNTELPIYRTAISGDYAIAGAIYVFEDMLIRCTKSGYLRGSLNVSSITDLDVNVKDTSASYDVLDYYTLGEANTNITRPFISSESTYGPETHKAFGNYLRCWRDLFHIDLMSLYNCFSYQFIDGINITYTAPYIEEVESSNYKTILIPIKFNQDYTIAIDCMSPVTVLPVFYQSHIGVLKSTITSKNYIFNDFEMKPFVLDSVSFKHPQKINIHTDNLNQFRYEKYLNLIISVPITNTSSIVVLEGDYTNTARSIINADSITKLSHDDLNRMLKSYPELLLINDKTSYAYNTKVITYLLHHVITHKDFTANIEMVQQLLNKIDPNRYDFITGVWNDNMRNVIYNKYFESPDSFTKYDNKGFVDKNIELYLNNLAQEQIINGDR